MLIRWCSATYSCPHNVSRASSALFFYLNTNIQTFCIAIETPYVTNFKNVPQTTITFGQKHIVFSMMGIVYVGIVLEFKASCISFFVSGLRQCMPGILGPH